MLPPHVERVEPAEESRALSNRISVYGNLLRIGLQDGPPVVRRRGLGLPVRCAWALSAQTTHPPDGMVGGATPSVLTIWLPSNCAGRRFSLCFMDYRATVTIAVDAVIESAPPTATGTTVGQLLRQLLRRV